MNAGEDQDLQLSVLGPQQTIAKFGDFIRNFQEDRTTNVYPYAYVLLMPDKIKQPYPGVVLLYVSTYILQ